MIGLARSVWNAPAAVPPPPRRVWRDWVLVALMWVSVLVEGAIVVAHVPLHTERSLVAVAVTGALVTTLLWRRRWPLVMLLIGYGVSGVLGIALDPPGQFDAAAFLLILPYALFRWASGRSMVIGLAALLVGVTVSATVSGTPLPDTIGAVIVLLLTLSLGLVFRFRASARMRELERAKSFEREQLARDLHDTVAHHVSAIAIQAQAGLAVAKKDPAAAARALGVIEGEASRTLAEMRSMVRVLRREGEPELEPGHSVRDLAEFAKADQSGPRVDVTLSGAVDDLPPTVAAAVYRLAQESVTNARRHAKHATRIEVEVDVDDARVRLEVRDDGDTVGGPGSGYGITGMTERAALFGGTLEAGRGLGGGWTVVAELPKSGWAL